MVAPHRLLDEGRRKVLDVPQHLEGTEGLKSLIVVESQINRVTELRADRLQMGEILSMRLHPRLDFVDTVAVGDHSAHSIHVGSEVRIGDRKGERDRVAHTPAEQISDGKAR